MIFLLLNGKDFNPPPPPLNGTPIKKKKISASLNIYWLFCFHYSYKILIPWAYILMQNTFLLLDFDLIQWTLFPAFGYSSRTVSQLLLPHFPRPQHFYNFLKLGPVF